MLTLYNITNLPFPINVYTYIYNTFFKENQVFCAATNERELVFGTVNKGVLVKDIAVTPTGGELTVTIPEITATKHGHISALSGKVVNITLPADVVHSDGNTAPNNIIVGAGTVTDKYGNKTKRK